MQPNLTWMIIIIPFPFFRCGNRYTHANRTCPVHPYHKPTRAVELVLQPNLSAGENTEEVQNWLESYRKERLDKTPGKTPTSSISISLSGKKIFQSKSESELLLGFFCLWGTYTKNAFCALGIASAMRNHLVPPDNC